MLIARPNEHPSLLNAYDTAKNVTCTNKNWPKCFPKKKNRKSSVVLRKPSELSITAAAGDDNSSITEAMSMAESGGDGLTKSGGRGSGVVLVSLETTIIQALKF